MPRPIAQVDLGDSDLHGGQQFIRLMNIEFHDQDPDRLILAAAEATIEPSMRTAWVCGSIDYLPRDLFGF
jgi:hypothetical protein